MTATAATAAVVACEPHSRSRLGACAPRDWVTVCVQCQLPIYRGEPRVIVRQRFAVCQSCLYLESQRDQSQRDHQPSPGKPSGAAIRSDTAGGQ